MTGSIRPVGRPRPSRPGDAVVYFSWLVSAERQRYDALSVLVNTQAGRIFEQSGDPALDAQTQRRAFAQLHRYLVRERIALENIRRSQPHPPADCGALDAYYSDARTMMEAYNRDASQAVLHQDAAALRQAQSRQQMIQSALWRADDELQRVLQARGEAQRMHILTTY